MRLLGFALAIALTIPVASADVSSDTIHTFNQALESGDRPMIIEASKALAAAAIANPEDEQSVLFAFEAASQLCTLGQCPEAEAASRFVTSAPITDPAEHPVTDDRNLLLSYVNWSLRKNRKTRKTFDKALESVLSLSPTPLSVKAVQDRYFYDIEENNTRALVQSSGQAGDHLRPVSDQLPRAYATAEMIAASTRFNSGQERLAHSKMIHLRGWLAEFTANSGEGVPEWTSAMAYRAHAWNLAMDAWFLSTGQRGVSEAEAEQILASYPSPTVSEVSTEQIDGLPFCEGYLKPDPELRYRGAQVAQGYYGAVIVAFDIKDGQVQNPVIKASVPLQQFDEQALEAISKWTWIANDHEVPGETCQMSRSDLAQPVVFSLD